MTQKLRINAKTGDPERALARLYERTEYHRLVSSTRYGGASPIYYQSLNRPYVIVYPGWWTEQDLREFGDMIPPTVLELEDDQHNAIIAELNRRSVFDATAR